MRNAALVVRPLPPQPLIPASSNATDNATAGPVLVPFFATLSGLVRVAGPGSAGASMAVVVERCAGGGAGWLAGWVPTLFAGVAGSNM